MPDQLTITAGGQSLTGWQTVRVTRGCERMPSDFDIALTERYPGQADIVVTPGESCVVSIGGDPVITGYIDRYGPAMSRGNHMVRIQGRSKCQDLVDCSAGIDTSGKSTGMQITTTSLVSLSTQLASAFGINVSTLTGNDVPVSASGGGPVQFNFVLTETPFEIIERVARYAGVLAYDDEGGNLVFAGPGASSMASGFQEGVNVQAASPMFSMDSRYSLYQPSIMSTDTFHDLGSGQFPFQPVTDDGVSRFRPLILVSEQAQNGQFIAQKRAQWEAARRRGRSQAVRVTCDSWRDSAGTLWQPNAFASVSLPSLKLAPSDPWVISEVTFVRDQDGGTTADLMLMPKEAFTPEPSILQLYDWQIGQDLQRGGASGAGTG